MEHDRVWFLNAMSAKDADVVDKPQLLVRVVGEPNEVNHVGHQVRRRRADNRKISSRPNSRPRGLRRHCRRRFNFMRSVRLNKNKEKKIVTTCAECRHDMRYQRNSP